MTKKFMLLGQIKLLEYLLGLPPGQYVSVRAVAKELKKDYGAATKLIKGMADLLEYIELVSPLRPWGGYRLKQESVDKAKELLAAACVRHIPTLALEELAANQPLTAQQLAENIGANVASMRETLTKLVDAGDVVRGHALTTAGKGRWPRTHSITPQGIETLKKKNQ